MVELLATPIAALIHTKGDLRTVWDEGNVVVGIVTMIVLRIGVHLHSMDLPAVIHRIFGMIGEAGLLRRKVHMILIMILVDHRTAEGVTRCLPFVGMKIWGTLIILADAVVAAPILFLLVATVVMTTTTIDVRNVDAAEVAAVTVGVPTVFPRLGPPPRVRMPPADAVSGVVADLLVRTDPIVPRVHTLLEVTVDHHHLRRLLQQRVKTTRLPRMNRRRIARTNALSLSRSL